MNRYVVRCEDLKKYVMDKKIGGGGQGKVYLVQRVAPKSTDYK